ncbi:hypothetical protein KIPB_000349, partial [Kipferlia bialata]
AIRFCVPYASAGTEPAPFAADERHTETEYQYVVMKCPKLVFGWSMSPCWGQTGGGGPLYQASNRNSLSGQMEMAVSASLAAECGIASEGHPLRAGTYSCSAELPEVEAAVLAERHTRLETAAKTVGQTYTPPAPVSPEGPGGAAGRGMFGGKGGRGGRGGRGRSSVSVDLHVNSRTCTDLSAFCVCIGMTDPATEPFDLLPPFSPKYAAGQRTPFEVSCSISAGSGSYFMSNMRAYTLKRGQVVVPGMDWTRQSGDSEVSVFSGHASMTFTCKVDGCRKTQLTYDGNGQVTLSANSKEAVRAMGALGVNTSAFPPSTFPLLSGNGAEGGVSMEFRACGAEGADPADMYRIPTWDMVESRVLGVDMQTLMRRRQQCEADGTPDLRDHCVHKAQAMGEGAGQAGMCTLMGSVGVPMGYKATPSCIGIPLFGMRSVRVSGATLRTLQHSDTPLLSILDLDMHLVDTEWMQDTVGKKQYQLEQDVQVSRNGMTHGPDSEQAQKAKPVPVRIPVRVCLTDDMSQHVGHPIDMGGEAIPGSAGSPLFMPFTVSSLLRHVGAVPQAESPFTDLSYDRSGVYGDLSLETQTLSLTLPLSAPFAGAPWEGERTVETRASVGVVLAVSLSGDCTSLTITLRPSSAPEGVEAEAQYAQARKGKTKKSKKQLKHEQNVQRNRKRYHRERGIDPEDDLRIRHDDEKASDEETTNDMDEYMEGEDY